MNKEKENSTLKIVFQLVKIPLLIAIFITPIRFTLEYIGIPEKYIFLIGLLWISLFFSIYWSFRIYKRKDSFLILFYFLLILSPISRIPVAIFWWIDVNWNLKTHYGAYFKTFYEALFNHIFYGSLIQLILGFLLGFLVILFLKFKSK
ncbi:hypothetical protein [Aureivirga marina]|uniref:hypothetical protein n=1 Tax=Aureivirga marina TaxID=1182451 RepID=UPI0018CB06FA|nr:hypothetical protein [Aureivirga marina]